MESPDISAIAVDSEDNSLIPKIGGFENSESIEESQSLLVNASVPYDNSEPIEESQSLLVNNNASMPDSETIGESESLLADMVESSEFEHAQHSEDLFASLEESRNQDSKMIDPEKNTESMEQENSETLKNQIMIEDSEVLETENTEDDIEEEMDAEAEDAKDDSDSDEENENTKKIVLPVNKIKKMMKICVTTNEESEEPNVEENPLKGKKKAGRGKAVKKVTTTLIGQDAVYLTTAATELFIAAITQQAGRMTVSSKKKTVSVEHIKKAMNDVECYEFLQGCFPPSLIGD